MKTKYFLLFILVGAFNGVKGQEEGDFNNLYMNAEVGKIKDYRQLIQGGVYLQMDRYYFKIKASSATVSLTDEQKQRFNHYHANCDCEQEQAGFQDIAFMLGRNITFLKSHQLQFGTGFSIFAKKELDEEYNRTAAPYELEKYNNRVTVGLPAELRYSFQFKRYLALSCTWNLNANFVKSYQAVSFGFGLGLF